MEFNQQLLVGAIGRHGEVTERERCESSLYEFLKRGWKYIDPAPFVGGWHLQAIAEHLQAVNDGHIRRLIINVPPRTSKSSLCSVAWPAFTWAQSHVGPCSGPHVQFLSASYAQTLSLRDSVKNRRLIESPWYKKYWGSRFAMTSDVNTKGRFENDRGGYRIATSVDGALTGEGGQIILIDDPHNATEVESDLVRASTLQWWDESMSTRLNDQHTGAYVVIMQRLHQEDLTGHILSRERDDWTWLMLPMEHDVSRHCATKLGPSLSWEDLRHEEGELLCPERFNKEAIENLTKRLGPFSAAGQLQQSPVPRGGGIIKEEWWGQWLESTFPPFEYVVASLDSAYTEKEENDPSALTIWGVYRNDNNQPRIMLIHGWQDHLTMPDLVERIMATCTVTPLPDSSKYKFKPRFRVDKLIIESKASGISVYQEIQRVLGFSANFGIELFNPTKLGDKQARVYSIQHLFSEGLVYIPWPKNKDGENKGQPATIGYKWAQEIINQITLFPRGPHDDFCFVAGTMIATKYGQRPIESIKVGEEVLTPAGWRKVRASGFTGVRPVISRFGLIGTPNHPIFTVDSGYMALDSASVALSRLRLCDMMKIMLLKSLNLMALPSAGWAAKDDTICHSQPQIPDAKGLRGCMWRFGNIMLVRKCRMAMKSIIRTVILSIFCLKIWSAYRGRSIAECLRGLALETRRTLSELGQRRLNGTDPKLAASGIGSTSMNQFTNLGTSALRWRLLDINCVSGVEKNSTIKVIAPCFVGGTALASTVDIGAEDINLFTPIMRPVFNLTVEGANCYYANGILVHNCDSMSMCLRWVRDSGILQRSEEAALDDRQELMYKPKVQSLYPV